ncbi:MULTISPECIES: DNA utilization protein GntX [Sodalis]|jgi:ComF family protein|uniref:ComF family protein n=1 Tax=Sodalis ligni TaxID=2697027 RepID=A0A4R1NC93_9GAMM|nr:DNA utilization protein GntX [Sodalis ligni]TCL05002.1 ComF family protein [Sodalis ligni]
MLTIGALCWLCRQPLWFSHQGICRCCAVRLLDARDRCCPRCGLPAGNAGRPCGRCLLKAPPWEILLYVTDYQPPISQLIKRLKYHGGIGLARVLARLLLLRWQEAHREQQVFRPELILNVPLHAYRHWRRGYNQTHLLAHTLSRWLEVDYRADALVRIRAAPPQQTLHAGARRRNLRGAFDCCIDVAGKTVALVDDVVTTGSTVEELTRLLLSRRAKAVQVWCICRTL